ncbi:MAG: Rrf2 family transcriptional regulator [Burkholderiaceae bacterium]|nr:Rrf2 family transcriptional regulator [Burkholderiaceae bacterium]
MRLTVYTDYALRLLTYAALSPDALITIGEVAAAYGISRNHLTKVAHQLGVAGFLTTVRGKGGGLRLACKPEAIRLGDVVRQTEPDMALVPCFEPIDTHCRILPACVLEGVLREARDAFLRVLDRHTLADLVGPRDKLRELLGLPPGIAPRTRRPARIPIRTG